MTRALLLIWLAACSTSAAQPAPKPVPPPENKFEEGMMLRFHMHENFGLMDTMERDLLLGQFDAARDLARAMAQAPEEAGAGAWAKQTARVRERAAAIASAKTIDAALKEDAQLAAACARCHIDTNARPEFARWPAQPPDGPSIEARMLRHLWAAERVREGVLGDAEASWTAGLDVLGAAPLPAVELGPQRTALAKTLQRQAQDARKRTDLDARATAYGDLLSTCAACHALKKK